MLHLYRRTSGASVSEKWLYGAFAIGRPSCFSNHSGPPIDKCSTDFWDFLTTGFPSLKHLCIDPNQIDFSTADGPPVTLPSLISHEIACLCGSFDDIIMLCRMMSTPAIQSLRSAPSTASFGNICEICKFGIVARTSIPRIAISGAGWLV
jgi:hypothetical protein